MAPNRGNKSGSSKWLGMLLLLCLSSRSRTMEGIMSDEDENRLRQIAPSVQSREDVPNKKSDDKAQASKSIPDSLPLTAVFSRKENVFMHLLDANRLSGVEPYQGDMLLDKVDKEQINQTRDDQKAKKMMSPEKFKEKMEQNERKNFIRRAEKLWVSRVVPYEIDSSRAAAKPKIEEAMRELESLSCLKFRLKQPGDQNWIRIFFGIGCYSDIGRSYMPGNPTSLSLGNMCDSKGLILHELMHALGFFHEQSRVDRDSFVTVYPENVRAGFESNFEVVESYEADVQDTDYDYDSIMQYGNTAFTKNGGDTMEPKFDPNKELGGKNLSAIDVIELNKAYQCHSKDKVWSDWGHWAPCMLDWNNKCSHHRQRYCFSEDKSKCEKADEYGVETVTEGCDESECNQKVDGHWGYWANWGRCSTTCDEGKRERARVCDNPKPQNGGKPCKGKARESDTCRIKRCHREPDDTNFEDGWGMWQQETDDNFDWELRTGGTPTLRTGPSKDHTTGDGYYAYIEGSPPRLPDEVARLSSKEFPPGFEDHCFTFFYIMNGKNIGYLDLHVKTKSNKIINLFRKNGHQGPDWLNAAVNIPDLKEPFKLVFEAKRGNGELSDIAIDDIYFDEKRCLLHDQGCQDHNPSCGDWAAIGECDLNKAWMKKHCCKACVEKGRCNNKDQQCIFWAKRAQCLKNKEWMWKNCCRSCRKCQNQHPDCDPWSKTGECESNSKWMSENCPASCKSCNLPMQ